MKDLEALYEKKIQRNLPDLAPQLIEIFHDYIAMRLDPNHCGPTVRQLPPEKMSDLPSPSKDVA